MGKCEYKIVNGNPKGSLLFPWASQRQRDSVGPASFEKKLNDLAGDGWRATPLRTFVASMMWPIPYREAVTFRSPGSRAPRRSRGRPRTLGRIPRKTRTPKAFHKNEGTCITPSA